MKKLSIQNLTIAINQEKYLILSLENKTDKYILYINPSNKQDDLFEKMEFKEELNITPKKKLKDLNFNVKIDTEKYTYSLFHGNNPVYFLKNNKNIIVNNLNFKLILGDGKIYSSGTDKNIIVNDQCPTKLNIIKSEPVIKKNLVDSILEKSDSKDLEDKKKLINLVSEPELSKVEVVPKIVSVNETKKVEASHKTVSVNEPIKAEVVPKTASVNESKKVEVAEKLSPVNESKKIEVLEKLSSVIESKKVEVVEKLNPVNKSKKVEVSEVIQTNNKVDHTSSEINLDTIVNDYNNLFNKDKAMDLFNPIISNKSLINLPDRTKAYSGMESEKLDTISSKIIPNADLKQQIPEVIALGDNLLDTKKSSNFIEIGSEGLNYEKLKPVLTKPISDLTENLNKKDSNLSDKIGLDVFSVQGTNKSTESLVEKDIEQIIRHYYNTSINYKSITYHFNTMNLEPSPNLNFSNLYVSETSTNNIIDNDSLAINLENKNNSYLFIYFNQKYLLNKINNSIVLTNLNTNNSQILKNGDIFKISNYDFLLYSNGTLLVPLVNKLGDSLINSRNLTQ